MEDRGARSGPSTGWPATWCTPLAQPLLRRRGCCIFGQGQKWYPGEPLPRWALGLYWRKDGQPVWRESSLVANEDTPAEIGLGRALEFE